MSPNAGFTLVELITVLVLLGILLALALPRFRGLFSTSGEAAVDEAVSALRFAQQQAMTRARRVRVTLSSGNNTIGMAYCDTFAARGDSCSDAGGSYEALQLPGGKADGNWELAESADWQASHTFYFSPLGQPVDGTGASLDADSDPGFPLEVGVAEARRQVRIEQETGYVRAVTS